MKIERKKGVKRFRIVEHNQSLLAWIILLSILLLFVIGFIIYLNVQEKNKPLQNSSQIANPASTYCISHNGKLELINNDSGSYGLCTLSNGQKCEEWAYFRGECGSQDNSSLSFCSTDSGCVPSTRCHPNSCVNKNSAPNCSGMMCTMMCAVDTLDCGQGSCGCIGGKCQVVLN